MKNAQRQSLACSDGAIMAGNVDVKALLDEIRPHFKVNTYQHHTEPSNPEGTRCVTTQHVTHKGDMKVRKKKAIIICGRGLHAESAKCILIFFFLPFR